MEVRDLVRRVSRHFFDLVNEDANPLVVALALQDNSSVGLQHYESEFKELRDELRKSLKSRVDDSYQGFNESVGVYRQVGSALKSGHEGIVDVTSRLTEMHTTMDHKKLILGELHNKSVRLKSKLELLEDLNLLYEFPNHFETLLAQKKFIEAGTLLGTTLERTNARNFIRQPNLKPLLQYLRRQRSQLVEQIVEETKQVIYLNSTSNLVKMATKKNNTFEYDDFVNKLDTILQQNDELNPNASHFKYLAQLIKLLNGLQTLEPFLDNLSSTLDEDLSEIKRINVSSIVSDLKITPAALRVAYERQREHGIDLRPLEILSQNLYFHFSKVLESYRALSLICSKLGLQYSLEHVAKALVRESNEFILQYIGKDLAKPALVRLHENNNAANANADATSVPSSFEEVLFEFGPEDEDAQGLRDFQVLYESIKQNIPGLLTSDPNNIYAETTQHEAIEVVCPASILSMKAIMDPALKFFEEAGKMLTNTSVTHLDQVLDNFFTTAFVPRLERKYEVLTVEIMQNVRALCSTNDWNSVSKLPINIGSYNFAQTLQAFVHLTDLDHQIRENYAGILIRLVQKMVNFLCSKLGHLFFIPSARQYILVWNLSTEKSYEYLMNKRLEGHPDNKREFEIYFSKRRTPFSTKSLITIADLLDVNIYKDIGLAITSLKWFTHWLRTILVRDIEPFSSELSGTSRLKQKWTLIDEKVKTQNLFTTSLLLDQNNKNAYEGLIMKVEQHAFRALCALRADLFFRIVYYFDQMIATHDFAGKGPGESRDPTVDQLQQELSHIHQVLSTYLMKDDIKFIFKDVPKFMNELFILNGENISDMDEYGQSQMLTNVFAFQQMSTSIVDDPDEVDFSRATWFYELFRLAPSLIIDRAKMNEANLGKEDLIKLLEIRHRNAANSGNGQSHSLGSLSFHLNQLNEIFDGTSRTEKPMNPGSLSRSASRVVSSSSTNSNNCVLESPVATQAPPLPLAKPTHSEAENQTYTSTEPPARTNNTARYSNTRPTSQLSSKSSFHSIDSQEGFRTNNYLDSDERTHSLTGNNHSDGSAKTDSFYSVNTPRNSHYSTNSRFDSKSSIHTLLNQNTAANQSQGQSQGQVPEHSRSYSQHQNLQPSGNSHQSKRNSNALNLNEQPSGNNFDELL